jgi:hypothetical protein
MRDFSFSLYGPFSGLASLLMPGMNGDEQKSSDLTVIASWRAILYRKFLT